MLKKALLGVFMAYGAVAYGENQTAVFAGGCFWCVQADFDKLPGVVSTTVGYDGGNTPNPTYESVSAGGTDYAESVKVVFDPSKVTYAQVVTYFLHHIDPTQANGQFCDHGKQYRSAIFYMNAKQEKIADQAIAAIKPNFKHVYTEVASSTQFYPAEAYHQDYYKKNPVRYKFYRWNCGRDAQVKLVWSKVEAKSTMPSDIAKYCNFDKAVRLKQLTPLQYAVTQKGETEKPFKNAYWNNKTPGIYVDIVSGEPLFSSTDQYKSGTGWPSFTKPINPNFIVEKADRTWYLAERTEVLSQCGNSHLGHVFDDGPAPTGKRYCMNSAAMRFIPAADLDKEGYDQFDYLF